MAKASPITVMTTTIMLFLIRPDRASAASAASSATLTLISTSLFSNPSAC